MADKYKIVIRLPKEIEQDLKDFAKANYNSINKEVLTAIRKHIKKKNK